LVTGIGCRNPRQELPELWSLTQMRLGASLDGFWVAVNSHEFEPGHRYVHHVAADQAAACTLPVWSRTSSGRIFGSEDAVHRTLGSKPVLAG
jgi:hypothetical protein